jgi:hypothetical protein
MRFRSVGWLFATPAESIRFESSARGTEIAAAASRAR